MGFAGIIVFWNNLKKIFFIIIEYKYSGWIVAGILIIIFLLALLVEKIKNRNQKPGILFILNPPMYKHRDYGKVELFNVLWHLWSGSNSLFEEGEQVWVDGPYCSIENCKCELENEHNKWLCIRCGKKYSIPKKIQEDTRDKVIKIFESGIENNKEIQKSRT